RPGAECDSCQKQHERQRAFCQAMGWQILAEEKDEAVSGDDPGREGFERALQAACDNKAVLVVYDITRFAREARLGLEMWDRLIKAKAHLAAVSEGINTLSPLGKHITKLLFTILSGVAEMQLTMIRERTSKAMRHHQANGRRMGRLDRCPYGKMPDPDGPMVKDKETGQPTDRPAGLIDNPQEQALIRKIRSLREQGKGLGFPEYSRLAWPFDTVLGKWPRANSEFEH